MNLHNMNVLVVGKNNYFWSYDTNYSDIWFLFIRSSGSGLMALTTKVSNLFIRILLLNFNHSNITILTMTGLFVKWRVDFFKVGLCVSQEILALSWHGKKIAKIKICYKKICKLFNIQSYCISWRDNCTTIKWAVLMLGHIQQKTSFAIQ